MRVTSNAQHDTTHRMSFNAGFLENEKSAYAERRVYGNPSTRYFQGHRVCYAPPSCSGLGCSGCDILRVTRHAARAIAGRNKTDAEGMYIGFRLGCDGRTETNAEKRDARERTE